MWRLSTPLLTTCRHFVLSDEKTHAPLSLLWTLGDSGNEAVQHQGDEGDEMQACDHLRQAFVVPGEAAEARRPCEGAPHHPAPGQHEGALGLLQLDDINADA